MTQSTSGPIQRVSYYKGQLLTASDLQTDLAHTAHLQQAHIAVHHHTWGIAVGYEVAVKSTRVELNPGVAYDSRGRVIISTETIAILPPALPANSTADAAWFDLLIEYDEQATMPEAGTRSVAWHQQYRMERPRWRWSYVADILTIPHPKPLRPGGETISPPDQGSAGQENGRLPDVNELLPVATGSFSDPAVLQGTALHVARLKVSRASTFTGVAADDYQRRRYVQGMIRPHIASGHISKKAPIQGSIWSWSIEVDTSSAGFTSLNPVYFVHLADHPLSENSEFARLLKPYTTSELMQKLLGPFAAIRSASTTRFTLEVRLALTGAGLADEKLKLLLIREKEISLPVDVDWIGMESIGGCLRRLD